MKIGSIVKVKANILSDKNDFIGRSGRVIEIEPKCEGEYITVLFDEPSGQGVLNLYKGTKAFCFSIGELEERR